MDNNSIEGGQLIRKGFGLKQVVEDDLIRDYHSGIVSKIIEAGNLYSEKDVTFHLARQFGFCYGVDRAVDLAYETRKRFPDRRIFLTAQIIHNPRVNKNLSEMGIRFLEDYSGVQKNDVVVLPAFGATASQIRMLQERGCVLVDTTCGSVLNVWKRVESYASQGFTSMIHGKYYHEETLATSSRVLRFPEGRYLVVFDMEETESVCRYIEKGGDRAKFLERFEKQVSPGFDPDLDLARIGVANQTTMLMSESLAISEKIKKSFVKKYGEEKLALHFRNFDTICSATEDRQNAMKDLIEKEFDLMIVIGGFNSSNTNQLAKIAAARVKTYHIEDKGCLVSASRIRHKPVGKFEAMVEENWLPPGKIQIGITSGASTPKQVMGDVIERILSFR
ncbi:MAG: 4-hydroxy-3-methylbut-2-enyl diphosphate reductase [Deltaproteobacteria bacterium]|nr:4-hydroxy-3-methylbut-2-enyl diphosphate reductase [Deltaproteobacteria bacterium]